MRYLILPLAVASLLHAQAVPNPTQNISARPAQQDAATPIYRVTVVGRTTKAVNYRSRSGATKVDFRGTALLPESRGEAKVESKQGYIEIEVEFDKLVAATKFGPEYLTYVMWAISPEGRATNLGEVLLNGTSSKLNVTTELQAFGLIVTAEPYYAVTQPSDVVVMENIVRSDTLGKVDQIDAKYELLQRGQYTMTAGANYKGQVLDAKVPLELYEARNAVEIARITGADRYAADSFKKAQNSLQQAENYQTRKSGRKPVTMMAREAVQTAEDSRLIAVRRIEEERLANERQAAADRENAARAATDAANAREAEQARQRAAAEEQARQEAARRAQAEADTQNAQRVRAEAEAATLRAQQERAAADAARAQADAARQAALAQQQASQAEAEKARMAAGEADRLRAQAEAERAGLRQRLLEQFNAILETRDTVRGLVVNLSDVLFDTGKYTLRPIAREKLARLSGIVLAYPGLRLEVEGHTDNVGGDAYNQKLSEQRATGVQDYLTQQGIRPDAISSRGFGETTPVASNDTAAGKQQNRRVELVVSGEVIGTNISTIRGTTPGAPVASPTPVPQR